MRGVVYLLLAWAAVSLSAFAAPTIDNGVASRLQGSGSTVDVIVMLYTGLPEGDDGFGYPDRSPASHAQIIEEMVSAHRQTFSALAREFSLANVPFDANRVRQLWLVGGVAMKIDALALEVLADSPWVDAVYYDEEVSLIPDEYVWEDLDKTVYTYGLEKIRIPELRKKHPELTGKGVRVGIIDTGIDESHPDLKGKVAWFHDFTNTEGKDPSVPFDDHGHGTHVAGTIAGFANSGKQIGVAPLASLVVAKGLDGAGSGTIAGLVEAMQWMADPDGNPDTSEDVPRLVSNSWGGRLDADDESPLYKAVDAWRKLQILPVFAAGNSGQYGRATIGTPGVFPISLAVGATDAEDAIADFSSRGPGVVTIKGETKEVPKPDVSAPGVAVLSAAPGGGWQRMSGTSMATPHVAGVAALLFQAARGLNADDAFKLLMSTSLDLGAPGFDFDFGAGRIDTVALIDAALTAF